jgi:SHS2 domain-containing protein
MRYSLPQPYEELDHTADVGLLVRGDSAAEALARLVLAFGVMLSGGGALAKEREMLIAVDASDHAAMAVDVLRELLFRFDCEQLIPVECEVREFDSERGAKVLVAVGSWDPDAHAEGLELKAVTLHAAVFEERDGQWLAQVVFDI